MRTMFLFSVVLVCVTMGLPVFAELAIPANPLWEPIEDEVYLQEVGSSIETEHPLNAVAVFKGKVYVGDDRGVYVMENEKLRPLDVPAQGVAQMKTLGDALWVASSSGLRKYDGSEWTSMAATPVADVCLHNGRIVFVSGKRLHTIEDAKVTVISDESPRPLLGVASYSGTCYVHDGKRVGLLQNGQIVYEEITDWGTLQRGCTVRDIFSCGSRLYVATDKGLGLLRGMTWYHIMGEDGLCYEDTTCLARGFDRDLWIGTMRGAIRDADDEYQFLGFPRWLPHDKVNAIACSDNAAYFAT
ncbi:MAG: hypothetical protein GY851_01595, partial [bacterium]|nr:hypothetical protein [bacterium]